MLRDQETTVRQTVRKGVKNSALLTNQRVLRSPVESLLRDLALVLHATAAVRREMEAERALCPAVA